MTVVDVCSLSILGHVFDDKLSQLTFQKITRLTFQHCTIYKTRQPRRWSNWSQRSPRTRKVGCMNPSLDRTMSKKQLVRQKTTKNPKTKAKPHKIKT